MKEKEPLPEDNNPIGLNKKEPSISKQGGENSPLKEVNENVAETEIKIKDMEVYHPHGIHHGRKLKDYILEFIMLFLAISGGFFMENLRESLSDRHKEKEYIGSLVKDLEKDTIEIQLKLKYNQTLIKGIDSLSNLLKSPISNANLPKLYNYTFSYLNQFGEFTPNETTIIQLKNSGGLRLIKNKSVSDSILNYYSTIDYYLETNGKLNEEFMNDNFKLEMLLFNFTALQTNKWKLYNVTKLDEFSNRAFIAKSFINWENIKLKEFYAHGSSLMNYLKKGYKIHN